MLRSARAQVACYVRRDEEKKEDIMLDAYVPPYRAGVVFPIMQAQYFSRLDDTVARGWAVTHCCKLSNR